MAADSKINQGKIDGLKPEDPRVEHKFIDVGGGITYHYLLANSTTGEPPVATIVLIHGWPDFSYGWRYQVPFLQSLGLRVVVPDMLGYGRTSAPDDHAEYSFKKMCGHIATLIQSVTGGAPIILGGHDWGGYFVWRMTRYYPDLITAVFSMCVPYEPPSPKVLTLEQIVERAPNFQYQLQLASPVAETLVNRSPATLRGFLNGLYGGRTPENEILFNTDVGIRDADMLERIQQSPMVSPAMMDYYVQEFSRSGMHGPCNWYRTRLVNGEEELPLAEEDARAGKPRQFAQPAMIVMAELDAALPPRLMQNQDQYFEKPLKKAVVKGASHWVMVQCPSESNQLIGEFLQGVLGDKIKASL
ncbi:Alpha/Beta hydrolase protein [Microdochium trichocladiopsis]|uniref:Alpha/Beta hydrolase protein n=1 Tax=Microdochium trichocladiopsis TaxID=1682393 RepID=A0A9P8YGW9_9PEZI|nr:Alpha/Beta hydrolase protein [Microdochium trichocladiopsis]KAH7037905.1 Alpha/Beta hydrolase protein [Microdochium trichocladiopsis]